MANQPLLVIGPFAGLDLTTDPFQLDPSKAAAAQNGDTVTRTKALMTILGRALIGSLGLPNGYTVQALVRLQTFVDASPALTYFLYSAVNGSGGSQQGVIHIPGGTSVVLSGLRPFTQAIQFEDGVWTNGAQQVRYRPEYGSPSGFFVDEWQVAPPAEVYGAIGSQSSSNVPGSGQYSYALTWRTSSIDGDPTIVENSSPFFLNGDVIVSGGVAASGEAQILSNPTNGDRIAIKINTTVVTVTASAFDTPYTIANDLAVEANANVTISALVSIGANASASGPLTGGLYIQAVAPGTAGNAITYLMRSAGSGMVSVTPNTATNLTSGAGGQAPTVIVQTNAIAITTPGGLQSDMVLWRFSELQPLYLEVGVVNTLNTVNAGGGNTRIIDDTPDSVIAFHAPLVNSGTGSDHHDPPPFATTVSAINASGATTHQTTWYIENHGFIESHKGRLWGFVLYPNLYNLKTTTTGQPAFQSLTEVQLQSQLWYSDFETPWSFNDVDSVATVGDEQTPGNAEWSPTLPGSPSQSNPYSPAGWDYVSVDDVPKGLATTGSYLVAFKSLSTFVVYGDDPNSFRVYAAFDIGCIASDSIAKGEGGVFWLSPQARVWFTAGTQPEYISEPIRFFLESLTVQQLQAAVGWHLNQTYYLCAGGVTFGYYVPTQQWFPLNINVPAVFSTEAAAYVATDDGHFAQWAISPNDLGAAITASSTSGIVDSNMVGMPKRYRYAVLDAPWQAGVKATIAVTFNPGTALATTWNSGDIPLDQTPGSQILSIPAAMSIAYNAQMTVTLTNPVGAPKQAILSRVALFGDTEHALKENRAQWQ